MERVLPKFIHQMSRGEPITVYGGDEKVLDFTYIDDCVDGIARGIERLADGRVKNETINLAYGQGNTLVRAAELIAAELGVEPQISQAPSLVGEVTHYVADIRKAHDLLEWDPQTPLDEGIPRAVRWFREWRAAHPEEDLPLAPTIAPARSSTASSSRPAQARRRSSRPQFAARRAIVDVPTCDGRRRSTARVALAPATPARVGRNPPPSRPTLSRAAIRRQMSFATILCQFIHRPVRPADPDRGCGVDSGP